MNIKKDFPLLTQATFSYLDNASTTQKPRQVLDAIQHAYTTYNANPGRGFYTLAERATEQYEQARAVVAQFIGAQPNEIIFTSNATMGINLVAQGWARTSFSAGDEMVITELEHHANIMPWQRVAQEKGIVLKVIPLLEDGLLDMDSLETIITEKTKLIACTHCSHATGAPVDILPLIARARMVGARTLIDACQTVPHQPINVTKLGCDFLVFSGHKLLGPTGVGVLYMRAEMQDQVEPLALGGGQPTFVDWHRYQLKKGPHTFEAGTPPFIQAIGLRAAIAYLQSNVPFEQLQRHEAALCTQLIDGLSSLDAVHILGPTALLKQQGHLVTFVIKNMHPHDVATYLDQEGIAVRAGTLCAQPLFQSLGYTTGAVRASFYLYSTADDVQRLIDAITRLCL